MTTSTEACPTPFLLGVNYWPRATGPAMWRRFDERVIAAEFAQMRAIGLTACRLFAVAPDFMPHPPTVDETMLARFVRVCELGAQAGLALLPTPLVGHMSGRNFDLGGRVTDGRSTHWHDTELLAWQVALVDALAQHAPPVAGWVLSNELPLWLGMPARHQHAIVRAHIAQLVHAVRRHRHGNRDEPISLGDGLMGDFPTSEVAPLVDYVGPHVYSADLDPERQAYAVDFAIRRAMALSDRPVLLEEFGASHLQGGEREQADYFRVAILSALSLGARGALAWCWSDFAVETVGLDEPYAHHPFEVGFGVTRADGSEKPVCDELRALSRLVTSVGALPPLASTTALLVPCVLEAPDEVPFSWQERGVAQRTLLAAYTAACQAGLDPELVLEPTDDAAGALARFTRILCPATQKLRTATWLALERAALNGATIYWSYFGGDYAFHQGAWCPNFTTLTGLVPRARYGTFWLPPPELHGTGAVALHIPTAPGAYDQEYARAGLPVELASNRVLVLCQADARTPLIVEQRIGRGRVVFATHPLERYRALTVGPSRALSPLYRHLAGHDADAEVQLRHNGDLVVALNRGPHDRSLAPLHDGTLLYAHDGPYGARVWRR